MFNKFEILGIAISMLSMAGALYLLNIQSGPLASAPANSQMASAVVVVGDKKNETEAVKKALLDGTNNKGIVEKLIIDDVVIGGGAEAKTGDSITVNYIGTLQNGQEFDNSNKRGEPFTFTLGEGRVIKGWEQGIAGMKEGGKRILVIPYDLAYGENGYGPIPAKATLVFSVDLLKVN